MRTKKAIYYDTHRHQQSAFESQQWWQKDDLWT